MSATVIYPDDLKQEILSFVGTHYKGAFKYLEKLPGDLEAGSIDVFHALDNLSAAHSGDKKTDSIRLGSFFDRDGSMISVDKIQALVTDAKAEDEAMKGKYAKRHELTGRVADVWVEQQGYQKGSLNGFTTLKGPEGESLREIADRQQKTVAVSEAQPVPQIG